MKPRQRILIVKLSAFGDIIQTLPVVKSLKNALPDSYIGWLVSRHCSEIVENVDFIDQVFIFERHRWGGFGNSWRYRREILHLVSAIRQARFGIILDFQGLLRSGAFTLLSGAPRRIGFANARELAFLAYNQKLKIDQKEIHAIDRYIRLANEVVPIDFDKKNILKLVENPLLSKRKNKQPTILLAPGASWQNKRWPTKHFATLVDSLYDQFQAYFAIVGANCDNSLATEIIGMSRHAHAITNLTGKTSMIELAAVINNADILICNDSGPMHLAAMLDIPVIALFGPTSPVRTGPYGKKSYNIQAKVSCAPCFKKSCHTIPCIQNIGPEQILPIMEKFLL